MAACTCRSARRGWQVPHPPACRPSPPQPPAPACERGGGQDSARRGVGRTHRCLLLAAAPRFRLLRCSSACARHPPFHLLCCSSPRPAAQPDSHWPSFRWRLRSRSSSAAWPEARRTWAGPRGGQAKDASMQITVGRWAAAMQQACGSREGTEPAPGQGRAFGPAGEAGGTAGRPGQLALQGANRAAGVSKPALALTLLQTRRPGAPAGGSSPLPPCPACRGGSGKQPG